MHVLKNSLMLDSTHLNSGCLHLKFSGTTYIEWSLYFTLMLWSQVVFSRSSSSLQDTFGCHLTSEHLAVYHPMSYSNSLSSFYCEMLSDTCHDGKGLNIHSCSNCKSCQVLEKGLQTGSVQMPTLTFSYGNQYWRVWVYICTNTSNAMIN